MCVVIVAGSGRGLNQVSDGHGPRVAVKLLERGMGKILLSVRSATILSPTLGPFQVIRQVTGRRQIDSLYRDGIHLRHHDPLSDAEAGATIAIRAMAAGAPL